MSQETTFWEEGDRYYERNAAHYRQYDVDQDLCAQMVDKHLLPKRIIDIGCCSGYRLAGLCRAFSANGLGFDGSDKALDEARREHAGLPIGWRRWLLGSEDRVQGYGAGADLVILSYVLHWVDRTRLIAAMKQIDDLTAVGGHVLINEFDPIERTERPYEHRDNVVTYKQQYDAMFIATGNYDIVDEHPYPYQEEDGGEDCAIILIKKRR